MIVDALNLLVGSISAAGALTGVTTLNAVAGTYVLGNSFDTGSLAIGSNQPREIGGGEPLRIAISMLSSLTSAGTTTFQIVQSDDANSTVNVEILAQSAPLPAAQLTAGTIIPMELDRAAPYAPRRFLGIRAVTSATTSTSSVAAAIVKDYQQIRNMLGRSGFTVV